MQLEIVMEKNALKQKDHRGVDAPLAVPLDVQLEIALQNQRLAELRYRASVKKGRAWNMPSRKARPI